MKLAIMQPTYLPWIGYFDLMGSVDLFVMLDDVQFAKRSWQQRNRIRTKDGLLWLTVPVRVHGRFHQRIADVEIADLGFSEAHARAIELNYRRARASDLYLGALTRILREGEPWHRLLDLNEQLILFIREQLSIKTPLLKASRVSTEGLKSERILNLCLALGATEYLSPIGSAAYLLPALNRFRDAEVSLLFQDYEHPVYRQVHSPFIPFASAIDLLLNEGTDARRIMRMGRRRPLLPQELPNSSG